MINKSCNIYEETKLWPEYRRAFAEFAQKARQMQMLRSLDSKPEDLLTAAIELEQARVIYRDRRDALAELLLPRELRVVSVACA